MYKRFLSNHQSLDTFLFFLIFLDSCQVVLLTQVGSLTRKGASCSMQQGWGGVNWKTLWMQHRWHMHSQSSFTFTQQAVINKCIFWALKNTQTVSSRLNAVQQNYTWNARPIESALNSDPQTKPRMQSCTLWKRNCISQAELIQRSSGCEENELTEKKKNNKNLLSASVVFLF